MTPGAVGRLAETYRRHEEKVRFLIIGVWNTLFSIGALWVFDRLIPYDSGDFLQKQAVLTASWVLSVTQNFFTFKLLVFRTKGNWLREYLRMYVTYAITFVIQSLLTQWISHAFETTLFWANLPTIALVTILSYLGHKYFTFRTPESILEERERSEQL